MSSRIYVVISSVDYGGGSRWPVPPNGRAFSGEPSERSERPERSEGRRVRCNAMLGDGVLIRVASSRARSSGRCIRRRPTNRGRRRTTCGNAARMPDRQPPWYDTGVWGAEKQTIE